MNAVFITGLFLFIFYQPNHYLLLTQIMNLQPTNLQNELIQLKPLAEADFDKLYLAASDPLTWEQHPNKERYKHDVFRSFFDGGIESKGAFAAIDIKTGEIIGSSRYYEYDDVNKSIAIGYTFLGRQHWGKQYNAMMKTLMLDYAFNFVDTVIFHIGANNFRSQKAITKLGAIKFDEAAVTYQGEQKAHLNYFYKITKAQWQERTAYKC